MPICNNSDCKERATHNYKNEKERLYCKNHKENNILILIQNQNIVLKKIVQLSQYIIL